MKYTLKEIATISAGQGAPQGENNYCEYGIPFVKAGNLLELIEGASIDDIQKVSDDVAKKHRLKLYPKGTILFAKSGMSCLKGYVYILPCDSYVVSHLACVTPHENISQYLKYYFDYNKPNKLIKDAAYPSISLSDIGELIVDIKDCESRKNIVSALSKIEMIIFARKQQLAKLDELIKARFVELFGDPIINDKNWLIDKLGNYMTTLTDFSANGSYELLDSNVVMYDEPNFAIMVRTTDLESGDLTSGVKYIDEFAYNLLDKSKLFGGELIMNKIGSAGKIYVMPHMNRPASLGRNAFMFRFDDRLNMTYLYALLSSDYGVNEIQQYVRGAVTKTITKDSTRSIRIVVPPIKLQNEFADFVKQVDKSKFVVQKALDEAQTLFDSLMQEYFG